MDGSVCWLREPGHGPCLSHSLSFNLRNSPGCAISSPRFYNSVWGCSVPELVNPNPREERPGKYSPSHSFLSHNGAQSLTPVSKVHGTCSPQKVKCQRILCTFKLQPSLCELQGSGRVGHSARTIGSLGWQRLFTRYQRVYLQSNSCQQVGLTAALL